jgi:hypothetical protein
MHSCFLLPTVVIQSNANASTASRTAVKAKLLSRLGGE